MINRIKRTESLFINNALFSRNHIPLQIDDREMLCYFCPDANFYLCMGDSIPANTRTYQSSNGYLFLTDRRLIFKSLSSVDANLDSFSLPVKYISLVSDKCEIVYKEMNDDFIIILSFNSTFKSAFLYEINRILKETVSIKENDIPYYSDIIKD